MILNQIYKYLCSFYDLPAHTLPELYLLNNFKTTDVRVNDMLNRESVLIKNIGNDEWEIGIYINPNILNRLNANEYNFDDMSCAIEGVSHFLYLINRVNNNIKCSPLELELQAEIDKFIVLTAIGRFQPWAARLALDNLFQNYSIINNLSKNKKELYFSASILAAEYCRKLFNYIIENKHEYMKKNIGYFFKSNLEDKIKTIHSQH